jgi:hypothetical protein
MHSKYNRFFESEAGKMNREPACLGKVEAGYWMEK